VHYDDGFQMATWPGRPASMNTARAPLQGGVDPWSIGRRCRASKYRANRDGGVAVDGYVLQLAKDIAGDSSERSWRCLLRKTGFAGHFVVHHFLPGLRPMRRRQQAFRPRTLPKPL
jgi:hypothetical protein